MNKSHLFSLSSIIKATPEGEKKVEIIIQFRRNLFIMLNNMLRKAVKKNMRYHIKYFLTVKYRTRVNTVDER